MYTHTYIDISANRTYLDTWWERQQRGTDLVEDFEGPFVGELLGGERVRVVMVRPQDTLSDCPAGDRCGPQNGHGSDDCQLLKLGIGKAREQANQVDGACAVSYHVAD